MGEESDTGRDAQVGAVLTALPVADCTAALTAMAGQRAAEVPPPACPSSLQ